MESERRERYERIKNSDVAAENTVTGDSEPAAGNSKCSGQAVWILYWATDSSTDRIPGSPLHAGQPGECDSAFHLLGGMPWDSGAVQDRKHSAWKDQ